MVTERKTKSIKRTQNSNYAGYRKKEEKKEERSIKPASCQLGDLADAGTRDKRAEHKGKSPVW
jgi:hypothetical protein